MNKKLYTLKEDSPVSNGFELIKKGVSAILITKENGMLSGILTRRDISFLNKEEIKKKKVIDVCTKENIITVPNGISKEQAISILKRYKIYHLPVVDRKGKVVDLIAYNEVLKQKIEGFVMLPFTEPYLTIFKNHIKKPIEAKFPATVKKVDDIFKSEPIVDTIQFLINKADFLIADISERNPNVYYEIGFAHGKEKNIIFITQDATNVPFDIAHWRCLKYDYTPPGIKKLEKELMEMVKEILQSREDNLTYLDNSI